MPKPNSEAKFLKASAKDNNSNTDRPIIGKEQHEELIVKPGRELLKACYDGNAGQVLELLMKN